MTSGGDFWTRRRAAVAAEEKARAQAEEARAAAEERARLEAKSDAEILAELDLPDPESLEAGDDISRFMAAAVPERLRRRALRRLWRVNPVLANVDGLVDYGEDFTDAATVVETLHTAWKLGRGLVPEPAPPAPTAVSGAGDEPGDGIGGSAVGDGAVGGDDGGRPESDGGDGAGELAHAGEPTGDAAVPDGGATQLPRPRRMRFEVDV